MTVVHAAAVLPADFGLSQLLSARMPVQFLTQHHLK